MFAVFIFICTFGACGATSERQGVIANPSISFAPEPAEIQAMRLPNRDGLHLAYKVESGMVHVALVEIISHKYRYISLIDDLKKADIIVNKNETSDFSLLKYDYNGADLLVTNKLNQIPTRIELLKSPIQKEYTLLNSKGVRANNLILANCLPAPSGLRINGGPAFVVAIKQSKETFCSNGFEKIDDILCPENVMPGDVAASNTRVYFIVCQYVIAIPISIGKSDLDRSKLLRPFEDANRLAESFMSKIMKERPLSLSQILAIKRDEAQADLNLYRCPSTRAWSYCAN